MADRVHTIAIDFDGVIHGYSRGWQDGSIYDEPLPGALNALRTLMAEHPVFIHTTRAPEQIVVWLVCRGIPATADDRCDTCDGRGTQTRIRQEPKPAPCARCQGSGRLTFWNRRGQLLVTNRKLAATVYLDDRAVRFRDWEQALTDLRALTAPAPTTALGRLERAAAEASTAGGRAALRLLAKVSAELRAIEAETYGQHDEEDDGKREAVRRIWAVIDAATMEAGRG